MTNETQQGEWFGWPVNDTNAVETTTPTPRRIRVLCAVPGCLNRVLVTPAGPCPARCAEHQEGPR